LITITLWTGITLIPCDSSAQILAPTPVAPPSGAPAQTFNAPPAQDLVPSIGRIFTDTLTDFRRLPSRDSAMILGIGGLAAMAGHPSDVRLSQSFSGSTSMSGAFGAGQTIGAATTQIAAAFATYSIGRVTGNPKVAVLGADLVRAQFVSQTMTQVLKLGTSRTRPDGTSLSFPSGHSASAFATAAVLQRHLGGRRASRPTLSPRMWRPHASRDNALLQRRGIWCGDRNGCRSHRSQSATGTHDSPSRRQRLPAVQA
jgi:hypothetical protein